MLLGFSLVLGQLVLCGAARTSAAASMMDKLRAEISRRVGNQSPQSAMMQQGGNPQGFLAQKQEQHQGGFPPQYDL